MAKPIQIYHKLAIVLIALSAVTAITIFVFANKISYNKPNTSVIQTRRPSAQLLEKLTERNERNERSEESGQKFSQEQQVDIRTNCAFTLPEKVEYKAEFIAQETKVWAEQGGVFEVSLYVKNTGNIPWFSDTSGCTEEAPMRLGTARVRDRSSIFYNPGDARWINHNRISMLEPRIEPGEIATFRFESHAPYVDDIFREYFQLVLEGKQWLERKEEHAHVDIYIGENYEDNEKQLFYLGASGQASKLDLSGKPYIHVDISEQKLRLNFGDTVVREYLVSTGTFKMPTPLGKFKILNKQDLRIGGSPPHYRMPQWQGFTKWGHGLHALPYLANDKGTFWKEALNHIGQRVSHGCVRLLPEDAEDLYKLTEVEMELEVHA